LLTDRYILVLIAIFSVLELYNTGLMLLLINRDKSIERREVAEYARLRERAEAKLAEQKSITAAATAENAPKKQAADARKAQAAAAKAKADAEIASAVATASAAKSKAVAEAQAALAELTRQQALVETEKAKKWLAFCALAAIFRASTVSGGSPCHSPRSHAIIFGFDPGERLGFMLLGPATSNGAVGPGPQVNVNIVEMTRDIFIFAEGGHDVIAQC